jgi:antitoxin MazE
MTHDPVDERPGARLTPPVSKGDNDLATRPPATLVDELDVVVADKATIESAAERRAFPEALARLRARNWTPPEGYRFDREEANKR